MDDVDELELDDDFFASGQPMAGLAVPATAKAVTISASRPLVAPSTLQQSAPLQHHKKGHGSGAFHCTAFKPLMAPLQTPNFSSNANVFRQPFQAPGSQTGQRGQSGPATTGLGAAKRPAEGLSSLSSKKVAIGAGQNTPISFSNQLPVNMQTARIEACQTHSGAMQHSAQAQQGPSHAVRASSQIHRRSVMQEQSVLLSSVDQRSSAMSLEHRPELSGYIIPGPAGMLQQQRNQGQPHTYTPIVSSRPHQHYHSSAQNDFANSAAWQLALRAANGHPCAGELV